MEEKLSRQQALDLLRRMALVLAPVNAVTLAPGQQAPEL